MRWNKVLWPPLAGLLFAAAGCIGPVDVFGVESYEYEQERLYREPDPGDDRIEDKDPTYDADGVTVSELFNGCTFKLNKTGTVTKLDIVEFDSDNQDLAGRLFRDWEAAYVHLAAREIGPIIASAELVDSSLAHFDDGLRAAIEYDLQVGIDGVRAGKRAFLYTLAEEINRAFVQAAPDQPDQAAHLESALVYVIAGLLAGGNQVTGMLDIDPAIVRAAQDEVDRFEADPQRTTPTGFYAWNDTLEEVYRQDGYLRNGWLAEDAQRTAQQVGRFAAIAAVLQTAEATDLKERYQGLLEVYRRLGNPLAAHTPASLFAYVDEIADLDDVMALRGQFLTDNPPLYPCAGSYFALFPATLAKVDVYLDDEYCARAVPEARTLADLISTAVESGDLTLTPDESSGWQDYRFHAAAFLFEPGGGPEYEHLLLTETYKTRTIEPFVVITEKQTETHAKMDDFGDREKTVVDLYPQFSVEPRFTYFLRKARGYRYLTHYLKSALGAGFLAASYRMSPGQAVPEQSLEAELGDVMQRTYGLAIVSARSLGIDPEDHLTAAEREEVETAACAVKAHEWLADDWYLDGTVLHDPRRAVRLGADRVNNETIYRVTVGVNVFRVYTEYVSGHGPKVVDYDEYDCAVRDFVSQTYYLFFPQTREVRISNAHPPLTDDELRAVCNRHHDADAIVAELEALQ